ncbi:MAG: dihydropyrimidinase [Oscillospiraceae bacterium]|nr:dihydropyrimidinase [Oscillospiraceae bacterium]
MTILKNGTLVTPEGMKKADLAMDGDKIVKIGENLTAGAGDTVMDVTGCIVFPGFIDGHTHLDLVNNLGHTSDNFETGTRGAVCGGTTTCMDMATQEHGDTLVHTMEVWKDLAQNISCNYGIHMSITDWNEHTKAEIQTMAAEGITTYKTYLAYGIAIGDVETMEVLKELKSVHGICGVHCENGPLIPALQKQVLDSGITSPAGHPISKPSELEAEAINRLCYIASLVDAPVNVVHLSSKLGLEEVRAARKRGQTVYAETCPQYLLFDDSVYSRPDGSKWVLSPPIRKPEDVAAIRQAVIDGEIQTISTDHCPFDFSLKQSQAAKGFDQIPGGGAGVEHRPILMLTHFKDDLDYVQLNKLMSENTAKLFNLYPKKGALLEGSDADITVYDPSVKWTISAANQHQNVDHTPYEGFEVVGRMKYVYVNGQLAVVDGDPTGVQAGKFVRADCV